MGKKIFLLSKQPSKATVSRLLKNKEVHLSKPNSTRFKKTRNKNGKAHALEVVLFEWFCDRYASRAKMSGALIKAKGKRPLQASNERRIPEEHLSLHFSDGWLSNFKKRWNLRFFKSNGESGDADLAVGSRELPRIQ